MRAVAKHEAGILEYERKGGMGIRHDFFGERGVVDTNPQAFLIERPYPNPVINPHFHDIDQFQVVVGGTGRIGKRPVKPIAFHYADAFTPYGPIIGEEDGIPFFTLRNCSSGGHWSMPGNKQFMPGRAGRNVAQLFDTDISRLQDGEIKQEALIEPFEDGLQVLAYYLGPNAETDAIPSNGGGQYHLVGSGFLLDGDKELPEHSLMRVERGETAAHYKAGPDGASVLCMQYPGPSNRPGSDPSNMERDGYSERQRPGN
ncbi:MAG: hypothetical protein HOB79_20475 [Rhodospirillaceae bacterium]|jgi:hypothetical protein|nr:hypothetical protein [Rhodospirillales bacterium]MBT3906470.1 hypothetical protein [Rhodospirillaceae bacterium]MBT4703457.1 hypothetical protein [Rhodospirillaceae bacterium]MBT5034279.1 hypothetical protein [Rhodospirillaceae bacterium]MBT6218148.1 hypothetical protein [Rhodospirillaceae bacterium]